MYCIVIQIKHGHEEEYGEYWVHCGVKLKMTGVEVIGGICEKFQAEGKFPAVAQTLPGTGCTSLPVYLPYSAV